MKVVRYGVEIDLSREGKIACPRCRKQGHDRKGDNLHVYGIGKDGKHRGAKCWRECGFYIPTQEQIEENEFKEGGYNVVGKHFDAEVNEQIKQETQTFGLGEDGKPYRGIPEKYTRPFGVRYEVDENNVVLKTFYPTTEDYELSGYKVRSHPKDFAEPGPYGETGRNCDLFMQFKFKNAAGKYVLITSGEHDALAGFYMLATRPGKDTDYPDIPVVSGTTGEGGLHIQLQNQYAWLDRFEKIIFCRDPDDAGLKCLEKVAQVVPRHKLHVMPLMSEKDPNEMLLQGKEKEFITAFYSAKKYVPEGIVGSSEIGDKIIEAATAPRVAFPKFYDKMNELTSGGIPLKRIVNIGSMCVDKDTEFLTKSGWKKISEYNGTDLVAQYNKDGTMSFVNPKRYVKVPAGKMYRVVNESIDMVLCEDHRIVYYASKEGKSKGNILEKKMKDVFTIHNKNATGFRGFIPTSFIYDGNGINMTEWELRLQIAVIADGRVVKEGKDNYTQMRFSKKRKYERLLFICKSGGLKYQDNTRGEDYDVIVWPKSATKVFGEEFYDCSQKQLQIIADEVSHWDGYLKRNSYTTTMKSNADFIQFVFHAVGSGGSIYEDKREDKYTGQYCSTVNRFKREWVNIRKTVKSDTKIEDFISEDGLKYCFEVDSGMLILRRNNKIFVTGNSGAGKSTIVDEFVYHWIFNAPYKVGIVTLESDAGEYGTKILSRHLGKKIELIADPIEKVNYLRSEYVLNKQRELLFTPSGEDRFFLVEERDGSFADIKKQVERLVRECSCQIIVLDPLQDILDGMSNEEQAVFMKWQKGLMKSDDVIIININHVRKNSGGQQANSTGAELYEEDFQGSSAIFKSGSLNILMMRNKEAECEIERNTTRSKVTKCRWTGRTSPKVCETFYDIESHTLFDLEEYKRMHPQKFLPTGEPNNPVDTKTATF